MPLAHGFWSLTTVYGSVNANCQGLPTLSPWSAFGATTLVRMSVGATVG